MPSPLPRPVLLPLAPLLAVVLASCRVGDDGPATPGSASARATEEVALLRQRAGRLESMAIELEEQATAARDLADPAARAAAAADIVARTEAIRAENAALQAEFAALVEELHVAAGDPTRQGAPPHHD